MIINNVINVVEYMYRPLNFLSQLVLFVAESHLHFPHTSSRNGSADYCREDYLYYGKILILNGGGVNKKVKSICRRSQFHV